MLVKVTTVMQYNSDLDDPAYREFLSKHQFCASFARNEGYFLSFFLPKKITTFNLKKSKFGEIPERKALNSIGDLKSCSGLKI